MSHAPAATAKQLGYLRRLAEQTATTFTPPKTRAQASREIKRLKTLSVSSREERRRERIELQRALLDDVPASSVEASEITGYGSEAHWRGKEPRS